MILNLTISILFYTNDVCLLNSDTFTIDSTILNKVLIYILILIIFIFPFNKIFNEKRLNKLKQNNKVKSLEQRALQSMMNPHFIFNVLNSIQFYLTSNDKINAQINLGRFAKLIRMNLEINQEKFISISNEVEYLKLYLSLEKLRFDEKFKYKIYIDPNINDKLVHIPSMILQPFVENSIWHGIAPQAGIGELVVEFLKGDNTLTIIVFDNGVGINTSMVNKSTHKSLGIKITNERLSIMRKIYNEEFSMKIIRVKNTDPLLSGTKVTLRIPLNLV
jgi:LytS/YehU family sensor histidine kinase